MKHIPIKISAAILTFLVGLTASAIWLSKPHQRFADDIYFPIGTFGVRENKMNWTAKFYSSGLAAMEEQPLQSLDDGESEAYRFFFLPSFDPPISIRVWKTGKQRYISVKQLSGPGVPQEGKAIFPKTLKVDTNRHITEEEWERFQALLKESNFWSSPTESGKQMGLDGASFLLEGIKPHQYHAIDRWLPADEGDFVNVSHYLVSISGLDTK
jgi:hypothetical protein